MTPYRRGRELSTEPSARDYESKSSLRFTQQVQLVGFVVTDVSRILWAPTEGARTSSLYPRSLRLVHHTLTPQTWGIGSFPNIRHCAWQNVFSNFQNVVDIMFDGIPLPLRSAENKNAIRRQNPAIPQRVMWLYFVQQIGPCQSIYTRQILHYYCQ